MYTKKRLVFAAVLREITPLSAVRRLDSNGDGVINEDDLVYKHMRVWIDIDGTGLCNYGETFSLSELGVEIILEEKEVQYRNNSEITILETFSYTMDDVKGRSFNAWGVYLMAL